jgi:hypothetical protein
LYHLPENVAYLTFYCITFSKFCAIFIVLNILLKNVATICCNSIFFAMGGEDFVAKHERTMSALNGRPDAGENEQPTATTALFFQ